jgi:hypothetical protein
MGEPSAIMKEMDRNQGNPGGAQGEQRFPGEGAEVFL